MKKRYKVVAVIILALVLGIVIIDSTKNTTFKEVILDHLNEKEVSSIEIARTCNGIEAKITVTDPSEIGLIIDGFSQLKLREGNFSDINPTESYWITIRTNETRHFGMTLYDKNYISIFDYNSNLNKSYTITNEFDLKVISELFR